MAYYSFYLDTNRGQPYYVVNGSEVNWIVVTGSAFSAPAGQFALTITLESATSPFGTFGSDLTFRQWTAGSPTTLLDVDFNGSVDNVISNGGSDRIIGHSGTGRGNYLQGDDIYDAGGNDWISGLAGNDTILGTGGSDTVEGGDNNDALYGDWDREDADQGNFIAGDDTVYGGAGDDSLYGDVGTNALYGGIGYDLLSYAGFFNDGNTQYRAVINMATGTAQIFGTDLVDHLTQVYANDTISDLEHLILTDGDDAVTLTGTPDLGFIYGLWVETGAGNDDITCGTERDVTYGGAGNDTIRGGGPADIYGQMDDLSGGMDNDIYVLTGTAVLHEYASGGNDTVQIGYATNFTLAAEFENLTLLTVAGAATGTGNGVANKIIGNTANNSLFGLAGNDVLLGGAGNDSLDGGLNDDQLRGGNGLDRLLGGSGNDTLYGDAGNDVLYGNAGSDVLSGGDGIDQLLSGQGRDVLTGGLAADRFVFNTAAEAGNGALHDRIVDFTTGIDKIQLKSIAAGQVFFASPVFSGTANEVIYSASTGLLEGDLNGDQIADYQIMLGVGTVLVAGDLVL